MRHKWFGIFTDGDGKVVGSSTTADGNAGTVSVYLAGTTTAADVYAASTGGTAVNSVSTDTHGYFSFWVDDSEYTPTQLFKLTLSHADFESKTYDDIKIIPDEPYKYFVDATATDQGAATTRADRSLKDLIDTISAKNTTVVFSNSGTGNNTTYTITTAETVPSNIRLVVEPGVILKIDGALTVSGAIQVQANAVLDVNAALTISGSIALEEGAYLDLAAATILDRIDAGSYRIFDGTLSNLTLTPTQEINATWGAGVPDGSTDQTTDLQGLLDACNNGFTIVFPDFGTSNYWKFNVVVGAGGYDNIILKGIGVNFTHIMPAVNASPVFDMEADYAKLINFNIEGNGAGTSVYGIRQDRDATTWPSGNIEVKNVRLQDFTYGIYIKNNYYGKYRDLKINDCTYGVFGRNACNDNYFSTSHFSTCDYGIAIKYESGTDANSSHSNTIDHCTFENLNSGGVGVWLYNIQGTRILNPYFEDCDWPVVDAGGAFMGYDNGAGGQNVYQDGWDRDLTKFGVVAGMSVDNVTEGTTDTIASIGDGNATNDELTMDNPGTITFDNEDLILVDIDATEPTVSGNTIIAPSIRSDLEQFLVGINHATTSLHGSWIRRQTGYTRFNLVTAQAVAQDTKTEFDLSGSYSNWNLRPLGKVLISYQIEANQNDDGYFTFGYVGHHSSMCVVYESIMGETKITDNTVSGIAEVPMSMLNSGSKFIIQYFSDIATKVSIKIHGFWH